MTRLFIKQGAGPAGSGRAIPRPTVLGLRASLPRWPSRRKPGRPGRAQIDVPGPAGRSIPCKVRVGLLPDGLRRVDSNCDSNGDSNGKQQRPATAHMRYDRARQNLDRHPNYILAAYMASGT